MKKLSKQSAMNAFPVGTRVKNTTSFHKSNLGSLWENLPCDLEGYVHTTQKGWLNARLDGMAWRGYTAAQKRERCKEMAEEARGAVKAAEANISDWRKANA